MEMSVGQKRVLKIFKGNECVNIPVPRNNLIYHLDAIGKSNDVSNKDKWEDISGNNKKFQMIGFDFKNNGWMNNCLYLNKSYIRYDNDKNYDKFTFNITFKFEQDGLLHFKVPGLEYCSIERGNLLIIISGRYIKCPNIIKENIVYNLTITYNFGQFVIYLNGEKIYSNTFRLSSNKIFEIGDESSNCYIFSILYYDIVLNESKILDISKIQLNRFISYIIKDCVMDIRGYNYTINYGGSKYLNDNSIHHNHLKTYNFYVHFPNHKAYSMIGNNYMELNDRYILNNSFTIEMGISNIYYNFSEETPLINNYDYKRCGFQVLIDTYDLIIRFHHKDNIKEIRKPLYYTNIICSISITYNYNTKKLCIYLNGTLAQIYDDIEYTHDIHTNKIIFCRDEKYPLNFIGDLHYIRLYNTDITPLEVLSNHQIDSNIYKRR